MDNPGWHAQRRAQKETEAYNREYRRSGVHQPVEDVAPMDESFIGGFRNHQPPSLLPPAPPPKDYPYISPKHDGGSAARVQQPQQQQELQQEQHTYAGGQMTNTISTNTNQLAHMNAVERSQALRVARMDPHLQFMCGPLLKYDTIDERGTWHGAALIVTADSGSIYDPHPTLTYTWDPDQQPPIHLRQTTTKSTIANSSTSASLSASTPTSIATATPPSHSHSRPSFSSSFHRPQNHAPPPPMPIPSTAFPSPTNPDNSYYPHSPPSNTNGSYSTHGSVQSKAKAAGLGLNIQMNTSSSPPKFPYELGPHPADPHSVVIPGALGGVAGSPVGSPPKHVHAFGVGPGMPLPVHSGNGNGSGTGNGHGAEDGKGYEQETSVRVEIVKGQEIWVYAGSGSTFTFWRFIIKIPLTSHEMAVQYSVNNGQQIEFWVPGKGENMRWAAHSCNGFSAGINPDDFRGPGFKSGYDPVWMDLLAKHQEAPFHALVGGGDQLYCDALMREPEMQEWVGKMKPEDKKAFPLLNEMELAIDRFFFNHYCQSFRRGAFARANCSIPMMNMCDDHDLIDGFGSYPDDLQRAPVFRQIGARGYFFFLLFQCFIQVEVDGLKDAPGKHLYKSLILGEPGPYVRFPSHSFLSRLGPKVYMLLLDCRAERKKNQVCSPGEYTRVFERLNALPIGVEHIIIQVGIPIAYPRMVFLETALESKFNPLVALGRNGTLGLSGFVNKFNAEAELLDDLNDHWTARSHKKERNWLIEQLQNFAKIKGIRVTFLSGDVHCAAVGVLKTLKVKNKPEVPPVADYRYMVNIVTSAIVNTPPPNGVITLVSSLATKVHKTLHSIDTDETMAPIFTKEPGTGQSRKQKFIMGRRNWCLVEWEEATGAMLFDIRVEKEKGLGETTGYLMHVPRPGW